MPQLRWTTQPHTLNLLDGRRPSRVRFMQEMKQQRSAGGVMEQINIQGYMEYTVDLWLMGASEYRKAVGFWSYARQGNSFSYITSTAKMTNVVIASSTAAVGSSSIKVSSSGDIAAGDILFLKAVDNDDEFELVKASSISSTTVTLTSKLLYNYSTGDIVRSQGYYPSVIMTDESFDPEPVHSTNMPSSGMWRLRLMFTESS